MSGEGDENKVCGLTAAAATRCTQSVESACLAHCLPTQAKGTACVRVNVVRMVACVANQSAAASTSLFEMI